VRPETARAIRALAREQPGVSAVGRILSMYMGPSDVLAVVDLDFEDGTSTENAAAAIAATEARVRARYPMINRLSAQHKAWPSARRSPRRSPATQVQASLLQRGNLRSPTLDGPASGARRFP
jgi:divalent metal cation (Fe/Co/Zn/Cd) transporter